MEWMAGNRYSKYVDAGKRYKDFEEAKKDIFKYVELFYNRRRRHASLGYVSPAEYEEISENERKQVA